MTNCGLPYYLSMVVIQRGRPGTQSALYRVISVIIYWPTTTAETIVIPRRASGAFSRGRGHFNGQKKQNECNESGRWKTKGKMKDFFQVDRLVARIIGKWWLVVTTFVVTLLLLGERDLCSHKPWAEHSLFTTLVTEIRLCSEFVRTNNI